MESERERTRARRGSRLWAALVLVHDGTNPNREWNHRRLPSAPVDLVVWTHWGAEPFSWNAWGVAARRRDRPGSTAEGRDQGVTQGTHDVSDSVRTTEIQDTSIR